jgi:quercetin dioxygenase-like cupin family protein
MPKVSKETAAKVVDAGPVEDRSSDLEGYTVGFTTFNATVDGVPLLKGLPNDQCACPHWGYVLKGEMSWTYDGVEEICKEGDAFYAPPGHTPAAVAGTEIVLFSPAKELAETEAVMMKNMEAMTGA